MAQKHKIAVTSPSFCRSQVLLTELAELGLELKINQTGQEFFGESLIEFIGNASILLVGRETITDEVMTRCPNLRFIAKYGVGLDNLDLEALKRHKLPFGFTPGVNKRSVSELVLSFALGHLRNVIPSIHLMSDGKWLKNGGRQLSDVTFGIVGLGNIGLDLAGLLCAFGSKVLYHDILPKECKLPIHSVSYDDLLTQSDVISFHVPLTPTTNKMFGDRELSLVKPTVLIINTARGHVVDFESTCKAVHQRKIGGFAADVFPTEPRDTSLLKHEYLYFTPHIGGNSKEAVLAMGRSAISHIKEYLAGSPHDPH